MCLSSYLRFYEEITTLSNGVFNKLLGGTSIVVARVRHLAFKSLAIIRSFSLTNNFFRRHEGASQDQKYSDLLNSAAGVVFLGTPLRGTPTTGMAGWIVLICAFMDKGTFTTLLQDLKDRSIALTRSSTTLRGWLFRTNCKFDVSTRLARLKS